MVYIVQYCSTAIPGKGTMKSLCYFYSLYSELMTAWSSFYQVGGSIEYIQLERSGGEAGGQNHFLFAAVFSFMENPLLQYVRVVIL